MRHEINILNNFFLKEEDEVPGDLQYDGRNFSDIKLLLKSIEEIRDVIRNSPNYISDERICGRRKNDITVMLLIQYTMMQAFINEQYGRPESVSKESIFLEIYGAMSARDIHIPENFFERSYPYNAGVQDFICKQANSVISKQINKRDYLVELGTIARAIKEPLTSLLPDLHLRRTTQQTRWLFQYGMQDRTGYTVAGGSPQEMQSTPKIG